MDSLSSMLIYGAALVAIVAMAATSIRRMRYALLVAGLGALGHSILGGQIVWAIVTFFFVAVNAVQIAVLRRRAKRGSMLEEELGLFDRMLGIEDPARQQRLRDLMEWRDVEEGEVLMTQGQTNPPLVYVARGSARVECDGKTVGLCGAEEFLGEMSLVSGQTASATAIVAERSRIATFDRDALAQYARAVPEVDTALTHALNRGLAAKVRRMNDAASGGGQENSGEA
ncbi:Crp/Fnr family transcriptional regulator [Qipengyuania flava]|uniref:Crp/Fnr family transcriptional regulator n=1 Tax=Qipengyuania flava TaxID=192812 RepID=UPI001C624CFE|nr:Crp/Fnr family transcriptional regulator [Qipengyuania flava]QYJ08389.1 Crp/Fnr family transcriptional regulator [Qipengyuania flava]